MDCESIKTYYIEICKRAYFKNNPNKIKNIYRSDKNNHCEDMKHFYDLYCNNSPKDIKPSNR
jgi:hypothetical protein